MKNFKFLMPCQVYKPRPFGFKFSIALQYLLVQLLHLLDLFEIGKISLLSSLWRLLGIQLECPKDDVMEEEVGDKTGPLFELTMKPAVTRLQFSECFPRD